MAESVVSFLIKNVSTLLIKEAQFLLGVSDQIRSVRDQLEWIRSFLKDADQKRHQDERVKIWVTQIRDAAYDVEDIIDTYILQVEQERQTNCCSRCFPYSSKLITIHMFGMQLKEIEERLEKISSNKIKYGLGNIQLGESSSSSRDVASKEKRSPIVEEADVVGFEEDAGKLASALLATGSPRRSVVSIVGMGGLGKTTLAKYVYNRRDVKGGFQLHAWVYVSQEHRVRDLLLSTLKQVTGRLSETEMKMDEEELNNKLLENLRWKRYLVVVDDIWAKEAWDIIEKAFPDDKNGSRIMLTTRIKEVALHADPSSTPHHLNRLNANNGWNLFCKKVFQAISCPEELKQLGKQIVDKASGLPLAIVVLGGLLSTKPKTHSIWQKVLESANWHLTEGSKQLAEVLALSYNDLPYYLKSCFLYFGMFPEDMEIKADRLIQLWIAEGFIQERGEETMEDVAEDYLEELIQRSMILVAERREDGSVKSCRMHDLLRDLAISEAKQDRFLEIHGCHHSIEAWRPRRLTAHPRKGMYNTNQQYTVENLRSLFLCFHGGLEGEIWRSFYSGVKLLRVLNIKGVPIKKLPKEIGDLILLKYLRLRVTKLRKLPDSIGNLVNLQTLDLKGTDVMVTHNIFKNLHQLRHLICPNSSPRDTCLCYWICNPSVSNRINHLRDLQTLEIKLGVWTNGSGLEQLTNLRRLYIFGELGPYSKLLSNSLPNFHRLQSLNLCDFSCVLRLPDGPTAYPPDYSNEPPLPLVSFSQHMQLTHLVLSGQLERLPKKEDFPPNLASLTLEGSYIKESDNSMDNMANPMATLEKLPNLRALILKWNVYMEKKMTCSRGGFANLRHLGIKFFDNLEEWIVEEGAMPNLRSLTVTYCDKLLVISDSLKRISLLKEVEFEYVPEEITNWWFESVSSAGGENINMDGRGGVD